MKRTFAVLGLAMAMILPALASNTQTITGEVVDIQCQAKKADNVGAGHEGCAMSCAKRGAKMGIMASDGVYAIAGDYTADNNARLVEFVAKKVKATGDVTEQDGMKVITVTEMMSAQ
jgi:hypothetical protein